MLYMVYEKFKTAGAKDVYRRSKEKGRMLPPGLTYVSSWVDLQFTRCFQLMETDDVSLFLKWANQWQDLVEFEIIPVRTSAEAIAINASAMRDPKKIGNTQRAKPCFLAFVKGKIRNMNF